MSSQYLIQYCYASLSSSNILMGYKEVKSLGKKNFINRSVHLPITSTNMQNTQHNGNPFYRKKAQTKSYTLILANIQPLHIARQCDTTVIKTTLCLIPTNLEHFEPSLCLKLRTLRSRKHQGEKLAETSKRKTKIIPLPTVASINIFYSHDLGHLPAEESQCKEVGVKPRVTWFTE